MYRRKRENLPVDVLCTPSPVVRVTRPLSRSRRAPLRAQSLLSSLLLLRAVVAVAVAEGQEQDQDDDEHERREHELHLQVLPPHAPAERAPRAVEVVLSLIHI